MGKDKTGIVENSIWNEIENYNIYEHCIGGIMHDGLEGGFDYHMGHVTDYVVNKAENKIPLHVIKDISPFDYMKHGFSNRGPLISESEVANQCLKMSASEMMAFIYTFPLLEGDLISQDKVWDFYHSLRKIKEISMAYGPESKAGFESRLELGPTSLVEDMTQINDTTDLSKLLLPKPFQSACLEVP